MRSLVALILAVACSFALAASAGAAPRAVVGNTWGPGITVSDGFIYWQEEDLSGTRIRRSDLQTGAVKTLVTLPITEPVGNLHAGGGRVAFSTMSFGLGNSFRIRFIERTGQSRVAAKSVSLSMSKRICESELALGAVSSTGELSWDTIVDKWNRSRCSAGKGRKVVVRSIGQAFGKSPRRLATPFHGSYKKYRNASRWFMTSRVFGLNDRYLLIGKRKGTVELVNRATGTRQTRTGLPATWEDYPETILASDGSSIGSTRVRSTANGAPIAHEVPLLYSQAGIRTELQPYSPGANSRAIFCGDRIVQLTTYTKTSAAVIVRDLNGAVTATLQHPEEPWPGEVDDFECDAHTVVFQVTVGQEEDLANYAFDL